MAQASYGCCGGIPTHYIFFFFLKRIVADVGHSQRSRPSVVTQNLCDIKWGFVIHSKCFVPKPKVRNLTFWLLQHTVIWLLNIQCIWLLQHTVYLAVIAYSNLAVKHTVYLVVTHTVYLVIFKTFFCFFYNNYIHFHGQQ